MRLQNKVTVITGAGHGIGKAYARRFAEEGAHVVIADIDEKAGQAVADTLGNAGLSTWARATDVRSYPSVEGLMRESVDRFGRIDVLLNNAAIYVTQQLWKGPVEELPLEEWDRVMQVNLRGFFLCCRGVIPIMKRQKSGKIINIASGTFFTGAGNMPHYTTSKGGVVALTRVMARQLGPWNINVNCMTPGSTMSEEVVTDEVRKRRETGSAQRCFSRIETPEDIVGTALFLASADSDFMTGQLLVVEGGAIMH
ncbi:MAG: SDR family oxidoreductase [Deltaproteobacteria bacterium]|nr:SDR family oxidoreductase [Deltaproteobacteria bacterium]